MVENKNVAENVLLCRQYFLCHRLYKCVGLRNPWSCTLLLKWKKQKRREKALNWMFYHIMSCGKLFPLIVRDSFALALGQLLLLSFFFVCWTMASGCNVTLGLWHTFLCFSDSICSKCVLSMCLISCTGCHILIRF